MQNSILNLTEVKDKFGFNPLGKVNHRDISSYKCFILSDVIEYMESTLPYKRFEPIAVEKGFLIIESKLHLI